MHPPQIPLTPQTNPQNFPVHDPHAPYGRSGHPYPKMITRPFTKEDRDKWLDRNRKTDRNTREEYFEERVPALGSLIPVLATQEMVDKQIARRVGDEVIAESAEQEKTILQMLGQEPEQKPSTFTVDQVVSANDPVAALEAENSRLRELLAEKAELERKLAVKPAEVAPKRRGRPPGTVKKRGFTAAELAGE